MHRVHMYVYFFHEYLPFAFPFIIFQLPTGLGLFLLGWAKTLAYTH